MSASLVAPEGTSCTANSAAVQVGSSVANLYTYAKGYYWTGSMWQVFPLLPASGATQTGDWIKGIGTGTVLRSGTPTYYIGYTCQWMGSAWKCGCRDSACVTPGWQLQAVN